MDRGWLQFMGLQRVRHNLMTKQQQQKIQKSINAIHHMKTKEKKVFSINTEAFNNIQYEFVQIKWTKFIQQHVISRNFLKLMKGTNKKFLHSTLYLMVNDNAFPPVWELDKEVFSQHSSLTYWCPLVLKLNKEKRFYKT